MIKGDNISLTIEKKTILNDVSFSVEKGRITSFIGKSGAGKTSLLRCMVNLIQDYQGTLTLDGKSIKDLSNKERVKHIGFVAQQFNLFPHMTVLRNCTHPLVKVLDMKADAAEQKGMQVLDSLHIKDLADRHPSKISGGQQQRVAISRAMCMEPEILLFDEPTSALDPESTKSLKELIKELNQKGMTIVLTTHDMPFVKSILDKIYFMDQGKIIESYDVKLDQLKQDGYVAKFLQHE